MPDSEENSSLRREMSLLRSDIREDMSSLKAQIDSMQKTVLSDYTQRLSGVEQFQVRAASDHMAIVDKLDALPTMAIVENKIELARAQLLAEAFGKIDAATQRRDDQIAAEKKAAADEMQKRDKTIERHDWVIKLVCALAGMIAVASIGAMVKYLGTAASTIDRIERLEQATPQRR